MTIDRAAFLKHRLGERAVELPGVGTIRVRGLSRQEVFDMKKEKDAEAMERRCVELAVVEPKLSAEDVAEWYANAPAGEIDMILTPIQELSALAAEGAAKSDVPAVRRGSRA
ncbi:MAG TPA: hypothetical protein VJQ57_04140 [Acidimicrobiia bacterium]|nr:hypothetical protein [Acidimicrobiia bacterium]